MREEDFEKLVGEAVSALPKHIREKMENVAVCIEKNPSQTGFKKRGSKISGILFGLYEGYPKTVWARNSISGRLPDKITIFQESIERFAKTKAGIKELVKLVVWHEIAHHFGFDEKKVRVLESKWRRGKNKNK